MLTTAVTAGDGRESAVSGVHRIASARRKSIATATTKSFQEPRPADEAPSRPVRGAATRIGELPGAGQPADPAWTALPSLLRQLSSTTSGAKYARAPGTLPAYTVSAPRRALLARSSSAPRFAEVEQADPSAEQAKGAAAAPPAAEALAVVSPENVVVSLGSEAGAVVSLGSEVGAVVSLGSEAGVVVSLGSEARAGGVRVSHPPLRHIQSARRVAPREMAPCEEAEMTARTRKDEQWADDVDGVIEASKEAGERLAVTAMVLALLYVTNARSGEEAREGMRDALGSFTVPASRSL